jgi:hypothetical protein
MEAVPEAIQGASEKDSHLYLVVITALQMGTKGEAEEEILRTSQTTDQPQVCATWPLVLLFLVSEKVGTLPPHSMLLTRSSTVLKRLQTTDIHSSGVRDEFILI